MKALVFYGIGDIRYESNWPEPPSPPPGFVKIATSWCGLCGTDIEDFRYGGVIPTKEPHPITGRMAPLVFGHEYSGRVAELGKDVTGLSVGQPVAIECVRACKTCYWCRRHQYQLCANLVSIGQQDDGGMAEYFTVPAENCILLPPDFPEEKVAVAEPFAVMIRAVRKARMQIGETVAVIGAGPIGLCGIAAARVAGASRVISIAHGGKRAEVAKAVGADYVLDSRQEHWQQEYLDLTDGMRADVVFDTGGTVEAMELAVDLTRRAGRCVFATVVDKPVQVQGLDMILNEKEIIGTVAHSHEEEFLWAVRYLVSGKTDLTPMVTSHVYIENGIEDGLEKVLRDRNEIKILITPHADWA